MSSWRWAKVLRSPFSGELSREARLRAAASGLRIGAPSMRPGAPPQSPRLRRVDSSPEVGVRKPRHREAGFTLTEVMVTILIIGLLSTIVLINVLPMGDTARVEKARADVRTLEQALEYYRLDMLDYPTTEQGLEALLSVPSGHPRADRYREGGYIRRLPEDPWGNPYQYAAPGQHGPVDVFSWGADGREGGEGLDADIGNWS